MRHRDARTRLTQKPAHARMLKRNLLTSILLYESVRTTKTRAKAVQPMVDRLITVAKKNPPHIAIRHINRFVTDKNASRKIMEVFKDRYAQRTSGLTRIVPAGVRDGDGALLVDFSLVDFEKPAPEAPAKKVKDVKQVEKKVVKQKLAKKAEEAKETEEKSSDSSDSSASSEASKFLKAKKETKKAPAAKKATPKKK